MMLMPISAVARREMRDNLTDWRMLVPVLILTFAVPFAIIAAAFYMISFTGDYGSVARLIPFGLLLSGFLPVSFSLITALESFVGEKERNTLESLLAMPMSDSELYLGKLIAALLPPLGSAMLAMATYACFFALGGDAEIHRRVSLDMMWLMVTLIAIKAVVMVAAAVIISSHTTTIRAANLLASFVLVPMATIVQLEALVIIAQQTQLLWNVCWAMLAIAIMLVRTGLNSFQREEILSREHAGFNFKRIGWTFRRFFSEYRPAGVPPERYKTNFSLKRFYRSEFPALLHDYRGPMIVAFVAVMTGLVFGYFAFGAYRAPWLDNFVTQSLGSAQQPSIIAGVGAAADNVRLAIFANVLSLFCFGLFAFLVPAAAFAQIGYVASWSAASGYTPSAFVLAYVVPHGVIELPMLILSAALGIRIGASILYAPRGFTIGQNMLWSLANWAKVFLFVLLPMIILSGAIKGLVTPLVAQAVFGP